MRRNLQLKDELIFSIAQNVNDFLICYKNCLTLDNCEGVTYSESTKLCYFTKITLFQNVTFDLTRTEVNEYHILYQKGKLTTKC